MLEYVPAWLGHLLLERRAGHEKLVIADAALTLGAGQIDLRSPAFAAGARLPERFTADGEGLSPPLLWSGIPDEAAALALIVEDPDAPAANPLVHAIVWNIAADQLRLAEGAIVADGSGDGVKDVGLSSFLHEGWLPPDPPTGHGEHDYVFQLFALSERPDIGATPDRDAFVKGIAGRVVASGILIGTYSRGEPQSTGGFRGAVLIGGLATS